MMRRLCLGLALLTVAAACSGPATGASPELQEQYLQAARSAGDRIGIRVPDSDWLEIADLVCRHSLETEADYQELLAEIRQDAPDPGRAEVMLDVARTAITIFCPP